MKTALKILAWTVGGLVALLLLIVLLLQLPGVRGAILSAALPRAERALPGRLTIEEASWPALGRFELAGIEWVAGSDTLAAADRIL
ncbi:MAG: hypothetical protein GF346_11310, partial [Candidatus Eisenbacteria bacterium]|nr:hypothetical protein [Candidatus Latescibacterota bacterium]MBD3303023.1 hypothetical protein [Candidatus Eisenbacteria bacterium]